MALFPIFSSPFDRDPETPILNALRRERLDDLEVGDPFEAFHHACETWQRVEGADRAAVGFYIDMILDKYLEDSDGV